MTTEKQVMEKLDEVLVPGVARSAVKMNLVREIKIADHKVDIALSSAAINEDAREWLKKEIDEAVKQLAGVKETSIIFHDGKPQDINQIQNRIAIMSGKGGVGKSLVTAMLAASLTRQGKDVGILDGDITGPSIPKILGVSKSRPIGDTSGLLPVPTRSGIEVMSINLVLEFEDDAVIWRGPLIGKALQQFWQDVLWGKLDYLLIDLPPGTSDAPLTVMQSMSLTGVIIVFSPQELATMVVKKAVKMANNMSIPILGLVENMSYFVVPGSKEKLELFGKSKLNEMAEQTGVSLKVQIPVDPELASLCDRGRIESYKLDEFDKFTRKLMQQLTPKSADNKNK
jgi:Mrp family chromosome partitioning ATPase